MCLHHIILDEGNVTVGKKNVTTEPLYMFACKLKLQLFLSIVPIVTSVNIQPKDPTSVVVSWDTSNSIINNYTVLYTQLCDNMKGTIVIENGTFNSLTIENLYPGFQYSVGITPLNIFGKGMEVNGMVTLEGTGMFVVTRHSRVVTSSLYILQVLLLELLC